MGRGPGLGAESLWQKHRPGHRCVGGAGSLVSHTRLSAHALLGEIAPDVVGQVLFWELARSPSHGPTLQPSNHLGRRTGLVSHAPGGACR